MIKVKNLVGSYSFQDNYLLRDPDLRILITSRKAQKGKKTVNFLVDKTSHNGNYISSLYPIPQYDNEAYNFDYRGIQYILTVDRVKGEGAILKKA